MAGESLDYERPQETATRWAVGLSLLIILGWVLFELTAQVPLALAVVCLKFGWEDFRTAVWLRKEDPCRARGWAEFWLFVSSGLWKTALVGYALLFCYCVVWAITDLVRGQAVGNMPLSELVVAGLTFLAASGVAVLTTWLAAVI